MQTLNGGGVLELLFLLKTWACIMYYYYMINLFANYAYS